jgi:hypothetical protein
VAEGTICITVSIETTIIQDEWINANAITAMKEALAKSTGVKIKSIDVNYANKLCKASSTFTLTREPTREPTRVPTRDPTSNRRFLATESMSLSSLVPSHRNSSPSLVYDTKIAENSIMHIASNGLHQLEFSFVLQLKG